MLQTTEQMADAARATRSRTAHWIDGGWRAGGGETIAVTNPATGRTLGTVPAAGREEVHEAVAAADRAFAGWAATPLEERLEHLRRFGDLLEKHADDFADTLTAESGMPRTLTRHMQVPFAIEVVRLAIADARDHPWEFRVGHSLVRQEPAGVIGCITPWNAPLVLIVQKLVPALAAGCTVVLKPSELAPFNAYLMFDLLAEIGLPQGVANLVVGTGPVAGEALASHPSVAVVSLTGSIRAGRRVAELAAGHSARVALEMGGKSASIVLPDADFETAVHATVEQVMFNAGQACFAWGRLLVPQERYDEAVELAAATAAALPVGDPMAPQTRVGPVIHEQARDRVLAMISEAVAGGARLVCGGKAAQPVAGGSFVEPTVLADVDPGSRLACEEVFGPVVAVMPYRDEQEAIRIADATDYGLSGAVWSTDVQHALDVAKRLRTGRVDVNGAPFNLKAPFGGYKSSGIGRELGRWGLEEFCEYKAIQLPPDADTDGDSAILIRA